jgi:protocatechuate 3,4-dioxygenase beta subunit
MNDPSLGWKTKKSTTQASFSKAFIFIATALLLALACLPALPQTRPSPSKPAPAPASGLYRIVGTVVNAVTGEPVRRAIVSVLAESDSHTIASVATDSDGRFTLESLPAAKYQLTASRRGFRTAFYDEHDEFNTAIVTGPDQKTENITFRLTPGSILRGVVTADGGDPVKDAYVMLFRKPRGHKPGERIAVAGGTMTDDTGAYEFGNLAPGEYLLAVHAEPWYAVHPTGGESHSRPANDPAVALDVAYPVTYFESTSDEAQASPIVLAGGNREEADFNLHAVPALHISLEAPRAEDASSAAAPPTLHQSIFGARDLSETTPPPMNSKQGMIEFSGVAPGHYELALPDPPRVVDLDATVSQQVDPTAAIPTVVVSGTLQTPSGSALPVMTIVTLDSLDPAHRENQIETNCTEGAFRFESVPPGSWQLSAINFLLSTTISGGSLPVTSISVSGRIHAGARITVRDRPLSLVVNIGLGEMRVEGFARINGKGLAGVMMVLVPKSRPAWQGLIRRDQSDSDGSFSLRDVVPGQYTVVAIQDGWTLDWADPQILGRYLPAGINVTVTGASGKLVTLGRPVPVQTRY